jgi:hypothetical protein
MACKMESATERCAGAPNLATFTKTVRDDRCRGIAARRGGWSEHSPVSGAAAIAQNGRPCGAVSFWANFRSRSASSSTSFAITGIWKRITAACRTGAARAVIWRSGCKTSAAVTSICSRWLPSARLSGNLGVTRFGRQRARRRTLPEARPLLFRGRSDLDSELRPTTALEGTANAFVNGTAVAVLDDVEELTTTKPGFVFALEGLRFRETFGASPASLTDLRPALQTGRRPRRKHVRELIADGLIDRTLGLTARGRRALALDALPARHVEVRTTPAISTRRPVAKHARENLSRVREALFLPATSSRVNIRRFPEHRCGHHGRVARRQERA